MIKTYIGYARVSTEDQNEARQLEPSGHSGNRSPRRLLTSAAARI